MMKTRNLIGMIAFCLFALAACTPSKESGKTLTVLSWNVWHGGHSKTYPEKGCKGTIDILKKSEADVILMVETYGAAPMVAVSFLIIFVFIAAIPLSGNMLLPTA